MFHRSANFVLCWVSIDRLILCWFGGFHGSTTVWCYWASIDLIVLAVYCDLPLIYDCLMFTELPLIWSLLAVIVSFHWSARVCCHQNSIDLLLRYDFVRRYGLSIDVLVFCFFFYDLGLNRSSNWSLDSINLLLSFGCLGFF